jgi:large subunit ribosomal protein L17
LVPDDLTRIEGIGPKIASLLQEAGLHTFGQLAEAEVERLETLLEANRLGMHDPATWPQQAALANAGDWDGLQSLQDRLKAGRKQDDKPA